MFIRFFRNKALFVHFGSHKDFSSEELRHKFYAFQNLVGLDLKDIKIRDQSSQWNHSEANRLARNGVSVPGFVGKSIVAGDMITMSGYSLENMYHSKKILTTIKYIESSKEIMEKILHELKENNSANIEYNLIYTDFIITNKDKNKLLYLISGIL